LFDVDGDIDRSCCTIVVGDDDDDVDDDDNSIPSIKLFTSLPDPNLIFIYKNANTTADYNSPQHQCLPQTIQNSDETHQIVFPFNNNLFI
jgi:hypothetical protein